jgi:hypothetical protein
MAATLLLQHACQHLHPRPNGEGEEPLPHGSGEGGELHAHPLGKLDPLLARLQAERNPFSLGHGGSLLLIARDLSRVEGRHLHFYGSRDILGLRQWGATNKGQDIEPWAPSWGGLDLERVEWPPARSPGGQEGSPRIWLCVSKPWHRGAAGGGVLVGGRRVPTGSRGNAFRHSSLRLRVAGRLDWEVDLDGGYRLESKTH